MHKNFTFKCVTEITRASHRLLREMVALSRLKQGALFCEMRAPSVCAMHPWCRMRSLFDAERVHLLHTSKRLTAFDRGWHNGSALRERVVKSHADVSLYKQRERWVLSYIHDGGVMDEELLANLSRPRLFHAYKWNSSVTLDAIPGLQGLHYDAEARGYGAVLRSSGELNLEDPG